MSNVVEFKFKNGYDHILFFLDSLETENTKTAYRKSIEQFMKWKWDIPVEHSQPELWNKLTYTDMERFKNYLRRKYSGTTINNRLTAIYSLMRQLNKYQDENGNHLYSINIDQLKVKSVKVREVESSGIITWEEVDNWIEYIKNSNMPNKNRKWTFLHIARITGLRKEALAELKYKDIRKSGEYWVIKSVLKGKTTKVAITNQDAQLLFDLWMNRGDKNEKVLKMSTKTMERLMDDIRNIFQIPEERNVTLHSIRGLAIYEAYVATGNSMLAAQKFANHASIETTYGYIKDRESIENSPSLYMGKEFNENCVKDLTQEQWIEIYKELSRSTKYEIQRAIERLGYSQA